MRIAGWVAATTMVMAAMLVSPARTADHRDAPGISEDGRADLLDVYAFVNPNNGNIVFVETVNPFQIGGAPGVAFGPDVLYEFKIDNTGDHVEDLVIQATFGPTTTSPQTFSVRGPARPRTTGSTSLLLEATPSASGPANGTIVTGSGSIARAFAGLRDDPFFFDLIWTFRLIGIQPGGPLARAPGIDFFASLNCSAIVIEVPAAAVRGSTGNVIRFWGTTSRVQNATRSSTPYLADVLRGPFVQIERMGLPVVNTVTIPTRLKDAFNRASPTQDHLFRDVAIGNLFAINNDRTYSSTLIDAVLLPDVLTLDTTRSVGFLNGRRPVDDVIDVILNAASNGAVAGDAVNANDMTFLSDFPFLAPAHGPESAIPARNKNP